MPDGQVNRSVLAKIIAFSGGGVLLSLGLCGIGSALAPNVEFGGGFGILSFFFGAACALVLGSGLIILAASLIVEQVQRLQRRNKDK